VKLLDFGLFFSSLFFSTSSNVYLLVAERNLYWIVQCCNNSLGKHGISIRPINADRN
jgi:hypothetical protein